MGNSVQLEDLWLSGVKAVQGESAVAAFLSQNAVPAPDAILAVGKAAASMAAGACARFADKPTLIVTKYGHLEHAPAHARVMEAAHPVPDNNSLLAGQAMLDFVKAVPAGAHLMMLVSGGASALAESLPDGMDLAALEAHTQKALGSGLDIHAMNSARKAMSRIKGGKLLRHFGGARVTTLAISDVEGDALGVIGSGIGDAAEEAVFDFAPHIIASNAVARTAIAARATKEEVHVATNDECLYEDVASLAPKLARRLQDAPSGLHIFGGEPTVVLPPNPGKGGRNMALALHLAREIAGTPGLRILVAGTDGTDGPTSAAGALVDGTTWGPGAAEALAAADAAPWLEERGALYNCGPTGTNVMDVALALKD